MGAGWRRLSPGQLRRILALLVSLSACGLLFASTSLYYAERSKVERSKNGAAASQRPADRQRRGAAAGHHPVTDPADAAAAVADAEPSDASAAAAARAYVGCLHYKWQLLSRHYEDSKDMQPAVCMRLCRARGHDYAALVGGSTCHCSAWTGDGAVRAAGRCLQPCAGDPTQRCGGGDHADVYSARLSDGDDDDVDAPWSTWMTVARTGGSRTADYASRFRECRPVETAAGDSAATATRACVAQTMRRSGGGGSPAPEVELASYVGCFVFGREPAATAVRWDGTARGCAVRCAAAATAYALVSGSDRSCRCANSLGIARPFHRCGALPPGVAVYLTAAPATMGDGGGGEAVPLVFDRPPPHRRKALLLAHHRGTRAMLHSRLLTVDDRATHVIEPELVFRDDLASDGARRLVLARLLQRHLACDTQRLPAAWVAAYAHAGPPAAAAAPGNAYQRCRLSHGVEACLPAFRAVCEASSTVSAATALLTDAKALRQFVADNNDTIVFHVLRDPLSVAALIKKSSRVQRLSAGRVVALCAALKQTRAAAAALAASGHAVYNVHFEEADADDLLASALRFYERLHGGVRLTTQERERVERLTRRLNATSAAAAESLPHLSPAESHAVDNACENFVYGE